MRYVKPSITNVKRAVEAIQGVGKVGMGSGQWHTGTQRSRRLRCGRVTIPYQRRANQPELYRKHKPGGLDYQLRLRSAA
jgi:hypothetical protein